jgi:hypothetical protein
MVSTGRMPEDWASARVSRKVPVMRIEELIIGVLLVVAMASYGFVAAITLLT